MIDIHHTRNSVKPETVKLVLFHVEAQVAHQETKDFMVAVVEQPAVPQFMTALTTFMEI